MMTIRVECPKCGAAFKAPAEAAGRQAKCRKCGEAFTLSEVPEVYALAAVEPPASRTTGVATAAPALPSELLTCRPTGDPVGTATASSPRAEKLIREAVAAGVFATIVTALASLSGWFGLTRWSLIDAGLIGALTYGVQRRSRVCAVLLLVFWGVEKAFMALAPGATWAERQAAIGGLLLFGAAFLAGVWGTFLHHRSGAGGPAPGRGGVTPVGSMPAVASAVHAVPWLDMRSGSATSEHGPSRLASICGTLSDMLPWNALRWLTVAGGTVAVVVYSLLYLSSRWEAERLAFLDDRIAEFRAQLEALRHVPAPKTRWGPRGFQGGKEEAEHAMEIQRLTSALDLAEADRAARARSYVPRTLRPVAYAGAGVLGLLLLPVFVGPILRRMVFQE